MTPAAANGALVSAINGDADRKLDIAGHSLGGHLAMAFGALFPGMTNQVSAFDAPGFIANSNNQSFFATLGGAVPTGIATTNVIADEARGSAAPWSAWAGMNGRPGTAIDIPIENQATGDEPFSTRPGALNHSQQTLTDALAVYATLAKLDPSLSPTTLKAILNAAVAGTSASLERIVDALESAFGINTDRLASGNAHRDALYRALYDLQANATYQSMQGSITFVSLTTQTAADLNTIASNPDALATRYALRELNPFAVLGLDYSRFNQNGELNLYDLATGSGTLTQSWLEDRAAMLTWLVAGNTSDRGYDITTGGINWQFQDLTSGQAAYALSTASAIDGARAAGADPGRLAALFQAELVRGTASRVAFGTEDAEIINGGGLTDRLYGGGDVLNGGDNYITNSTGLSNTIGLGIPENFLAFRTYDWSVTAGNDPFDTRYSYVQSIDTAALVGGADVIFGGAGGDRRMGESQSPRHGEFNAGWTIANAVSNSMNWRIAA